MQTENISVGQILLVVVRYGNFIPAYVAANATTVPQLGVPEILLIILPPQLTSNTRTTSGIILTTSCIFMHA